MLVSSVIWQMGNVFLCTPRQLDRELSDDERRRSLVTLEVLPDVDGDGGFRFDLDCVFQVIAFRTRGKPANYYAGSGGGQVEFVAHYGQILDHTPAVQIAVEHVSSYARARKATFGIKPEIELKEGGSTATASGGEATLQIGQNETHETKLTLTECSLSVIRHAGSVAWDLAQPRVAFAVQDFVSANLALFATARWARSDRNGKIRFTPDRLEFYDVNRRPLGKLKSLLMWRTLRRFTKDVHHGDGVSLDFEVKTDA